MSLKTRARTWCVPGPPVGGRRALVEDPRLGALAAAHRLREDVALAPALEHCLLEVGERLRGIDGARRHASGHSRKGRAVRGRPATRRPASARRYARLGELAADRRERALLVLVEHRERALDALGVLGEEAVDDLAAVGRQRRRAAARRSCGSRERSHAAARLERVDDLGRVGLRGLEAAAHARAARARPPAVARITRTKKPVDERPSRSRSVARRRRTLDSARSSDSSARWASGSPGTSCIARGSCRRAGRRGQRSSRRSRARALDVAERLEAVEPVQAGRLGGPQLAAVERGDELVDRGERLGRPGA